MKNFLFLPFFFLISCKENVSRKLTASDIRIELEKNNPFLSEFKRTLEVNVDGDSEQAELKFDSGSGCNSYLFEEENRFIITDCDGTWYTIDKSTHKISPLGRYWRKLPKAKYVCTYVISKKLRKTIIVKEKDINLDLMYLYGGEM